jgi:hypothetical protein
MEILKYLDVLIGLAIVMLMLSPLVSAFTQACLWLFNARSGRLEVGLTSLLMELNGAPYERFESAEITGLAPLAPVTFAQPASQPAISANADAAGSLVLTQNIPAMLAANGGDLLPSLTLPATPPGAAAPVIRLRPREGGAGSQPNPLPSPVSLSLTQAEKIAGAVLLHPMIGQPPFWKLPLPRKGEVVEREQLIRVLLGFAANPTTIPGSPKLDPAVAAAMQNLRQIVADNGVPDPGRAIADIRDAALRLELTDAAAAAHDRLSKAILQAAHSTFVGRINLWFDHIMDRTTAEYKFRAQLVTMLGALLVATVVQLDSIELLRRLSTDDKLRDSLVQQAQIQQSRFDEQQTTPAPARDQTELEVARARRDEIESNLAKLRDPQLAVLPDHFIWQPLPRASLSRNPAWTPPYSPRLELVVGTNIFPLQPNWTADPLADIESAVRNSNAPVKAVREKRGDHDDLVLTSRNLGTVQLRSTPGTPETNMLNAAPEWSCNGPVCFDRDLFDQSWRGVLLTWVLLSLGAPFWYDALKDMLKLRSTVAKKEEDARIERQTDTTPAGKPGTAT